MSKLVVGFDSILFSRRLIETPQKYFKAFMSVGITVDDEYSFRRVYDEALDEVFEEKGMKKRR